MGGELSDCLSFQNILERGDKQNDRGKLLREYQKGLAWHLTTMNAFGKEPESTTYPAHYPAIAFSNGKIYNADLLEIRDDPDFLSRIPGRIANRDQKTFEKYTSELHRVLMKTN